MESASGRSQRRAITTAIAVAVVAVAAVAAATTKTLAATVIAGVTDNNQPKAAKEEMAAKTAMAK
jgi:hypothetical protein